MNTFLDVISEVVEILYISLKIILRLDNGGKFITKKFTTYCLDNDIKR